MNLEPNAGISSGHLSVITRIRTIYAKSACTVSLTKTMADADSELRQRKSKQSIDETAKGNEEYNQKQEKEPFVKENVKLTVSSSKCFEGGTYWLTRIVLLRYIAFIYCTWSFIRQVPYKQFTKVSAIYCLAT